MRERKNTVTNIIIVILTMILFVLIVALVFNTKPRKNGYYTVAPANTMLWNLERGRYETLLEDKYINTGLSITAEKNDAYQVPYAAADYYEAAFNYYGYSQAGLDDKASGYKETMDSSRKKLGQYEYLADGIDDFLTMQGDKGE